MGETILLCYGTVAVWLSGFGAGVWEGRGNARTWRTTLVDVCLAAAWPITCAFGAYLSYKEAHNAD